MQSKSSEYWDYVRILREELVPATGCTEPIALAYAAARAREALGAMPAAVRVEVSGNILKNAKSVVVPNTGGLKGVEAAVAAGIVAGDAARALEVLAGVTEEDKPRIREYRETADIRVIPYEGDLVFSIRMDVFAGGSRAGVVIEQYHTNVVRIEKDGETLFRAGDSTGGAAVPDRVALNVRDIVEFADVADLADIQDIVGRQIEINSAIAADGLENPWGANIGKVLLEAYGNGVSIRAKALAAAGADARMGGCEKPVVILSGSGNQSLAASLPIVAYAEALRAPRDRLLRAVALADLLVVHQKAGIGRLSAFCGAISAGCATGAGVAYLEGGGYDAVAHTIVNALAIVSGIVCDGAKPSCAAKIAAAVDAGILGWNMYRNGQEFCGGDGIITKGADNTIANVGRMASKGMRETDREILRIMVEC